MPTRIAVVGAECTGKTLLSLALAQKLNRPTHPWISVPEVLRQWCDKHQRTPQASEQRAIAHAQAHEIDTVYQTGASVVSDTTPLMTAIYSDLLFEDTSLYPFALEYQRKFALTLLSGLDLPWVPDGFQRDGPTARLAVDTRLRSVLQDNHIRFAVVYGTGDARTQTALEAVGQVQNMHFPRSPHDTEWRWLCDSCSDPECEHRLFTGLL